MAQPRSPFVHGVMAEFDDPNSLIAATRRAHHEGYRCMDAYSPYPIEELHEALGSRHTRLPLIVLIGGLCGCIGGYALQYWVSVIAYPLNIGGKPFHSWPAFIPITFECTILVAALSAVLGMLALNGLPMPYHPVFNVARFALASRNRFFLCIESRDPKFDLERTRHFLETLGPREVSTVAD
jgi:ActD protein